MNYRSYATVSAATLLMNVGKFLTDIAASFGRESLVFLRGILLIPVITKLLGIDAGVELLQSLSIL